MSVSKENSIRKRKKNLPNLDYITDVIYIIN